MNENPKESQNDLPLRRREGLHVRDVEGETVILDAERELMHSLNATAAFIFESIDGSRSLEAIGQEVAEYFETTIETAERDTKEVIARLRELELVL